MCEKCNPHLRLGRSERHVPINFGFVDPDGSVADSANTSHIHLVGMTTISTVSNRSACIHKFKINWDTSLTTSKPQMTVAFLTHDLYYVSSNGYFYYHNNAKKEKKWQKTTKTNKFKTLDVQSIIVQKYKNK